ncbi:winged helix-turn-helix transcriptional regulator [Halomonas denitrificans]|nr:helix-turn-helix transcriptional regulator [Halomonas denitrificans]
MSRKPASIEHCPIARVTELLGDHWALMILREAFLGTVHFGQFETHLGIARNILSGRLKRLVDAGLLDRVPCPDDRRVHEYRLSPSGRALHPVLIALAQWSQRWLGDACEALQIVERSSGEAVRPVVVQAADGRTLDLREIAMVPGPDAAPEMAERYRMAMRASKRASSKGAGGDG